MICDLGRQQESASADRAERADIWVERGREVLRQTSAALQNRVVTLWEVGLRGQVDPVLTSVASPPYHATRLDLDRTLHRWSTPIVAGSRWVGCRLSEEGQWCLAPVRRQPAAPPPDGIERRSRERLTLELAGLCLGVVAGSVDPQTPASGAAGSVPDSFRCAGSAVTTPIAAARASIELSLARLRMAENLHAPFRAALFDELAGVAAGLDLAHLLVRSGGMSPPPLFDPGPIVQLCVLLERPLARTQGIGVHAVIDPEPGCVAGDPADFYRVVTGLIRAAGSASDGRVAPVRVRLEQARHVVRLTVERCVGDAPGVPGSGSGQPSRDVPSWPALAGLDRLVQERLKGQVVVGLGHAAGVEEWVTVMLPMVRCDS